MSPIGDICNNVVIVMFGSFSPINKGTILLATRAREYLEWHGIKVLEGRCYPSGNDTFMNLEDKVEACNMAFQEEWGEDTWI